jgi:hypothetical protein
MEEGIMDQCLSETAKVQTPWITRAATLFAAWAAKWAAKWAAEVRAGLSRAAMNRHVLRRQPDILQFAL